ncbi:MAG: hypothetical protein AUH89_00065 [Ktedonobacter sp. 13_1_40CM_4_52_4]|nr:MAG: hypothetical protein AUH89_00065 [Ktedonobacter sp. 13_1_40CM_4_52_4]
MKSFVNREAELEVIDKAFDALIDNKSLLRTPIVDFYGVEGIGKTAILEKIEQKCNDHNIRYIWANASKDISHFSGEITQQLQTKYRVELQNDEEDWSHRPLNATRALLERGPVVMLLDSVDTTDVEQVRWLETMLRDLIEDNTLFVVLTSKRMLSFERERSVARKLTFVPVKPFDRSNSELYLNSISDRIDPELHKVIFDPELRKVIFEWTRGYPLAIDVMVQAILSEQRLDPRRSQDQQQLLDIIIKQVINQGILAKVERTELSWYQSALTLLSVPRRFNLVIMQDMIETFAPELRLESSLAYMGLPKRINAATDVLSWNMPRAGFSVDAPIRHIFLLKQRIEQPGTFATINRFLADINKRFTEEVPGSDRVRYLREYLYHSASTGDNQALPPILERTVREVIAGPPESFLQFFEEFSRDEELKEVLGSSVNIALSLIHRHLAETSRQSAKESSGADHLRALQDIFYHLMNDPENIDLPSTLKQHLEEVIQAELPETSFKLFEELSRDERFKEALGHDFDRFSLLIRNNLSTER